MDNKNILTSTFGWLFVGLLVCFGVSFFTTYNLDILNVAFLWAGSSTVFIYVILELVVVVALSFFIKKLPPIVAKILYLLYTALTGLSLTGVVLVYTAKSIAFVFLATAIIFGVFALVGKYSKLDLSKWSTYLFIALLGILILEIINIFVLNETLDMITSIVGIVVFAGYVAYDIKKVIVLADSAVSDESNIGIYCAFQLFLDIINIFLDLIRLFGRRND